MAAADAVAAVARQHRTRIVRPKLVLSVWIGADVRQRMTVRFAVVVVRGLEFAGRSGLSC
jgi:hypothetical protein